ncbi:hypothetical protein McpSp1_09100 [Methanocorpusculaceae archaeon Sp1]|nr:hypothetical protein [Methanocorpusculaceae archaeon Sp1]
MTQKPLWKTHPQLKDKEWLLEQKRAGKSNRVIAAEIGVCEKSVGAACRFHKIKLPIIIINDSILKNKLNL